MYFTMKYIELIGYRCVFISSFTCPLPQGGVAVDNSLKKIIGPLFNMALCSKLAETCFGFCLFN